MKTAIVNVYVSLVRKGAKTIEEIPESIREDVENILNPKEEESQE